MLKLSYNSGAVFRSCPKKYYWRYIKGYKPIIRPISLALGSVLHDAFDKFYKGSSEDNILNDIGTKFNEMIGSVEATDQEDWLIAKYTAMGMWLYFPYKKEKFEALATEEEFAIPLDTDVVFVGKVDGRVKKKGIWWVRELKTTSLSFRQFQGKCQTSAQGTGYVYGLLPKYDIQGILYDYVKKPILRKGMKETADDFGRRIMRDYKLRPKYYYNRYHSYRNPVDIKNFSEDTIKLAYDILDKIQSGSFYRNLDQCWHWGKECEYAKICFQEVPDQLTLDLYYTQGKEEEDARLNRPATGNQS